MERNTHNFRQCHISNGKEQRLIFQDAPHLMPEFEDSESRKKDAKPDAPQSEQVAKEIAGRLAGYDRLSKNDQREVLDTIIGECSLSANLLKDAGEFTTYMGDLSKKLEALGVSREITDAVVKELYGREPAYEETVDSPRVSRLFEDRASVNGRSTRPDGSEQLLYKRMQLHGSLAPGESGAPDETVTLTNNVKKSVDDLVDTMIPKIKIEDGKEVVKSEGSRAVDLDHVAERFREETRNIRRENLYLLRSKEKLAKRRMVRLHRAMKRGGGYAFFQNLAMQEAQQKFDGARQQREWNTVRIKKYGGLIRRLQDAKEDRLERFPAERMAMRSRAATKTRHSLLRRARFLKNEELEIAPGTHRTVTVIPGDVARMSDPEYAQNYCERTRDALNKSAMRQLHDAVTGGQLEAAKAKIEATLRGWTGDKRIRVHPKENLIDVSNGKVHIRLLPHFYDPNTGKPIETRESGKISLDEVPFGGLALGETLAWEVTDATVDDDHWRASLQTTDVTRALSRVASILENNAVSPQEMRDFVAKKNRAEFDVARDESGRPIPDSFGGPKRIERPAEKIRFTYTTLNEAVARELGKFRGETIVLDNISTISPDAVRALITGWNGADKRLFFGNTDDSSEYSFPIFDKPEIAGALGGFQGKIYFKGIKDISFKPSHRQALEHLSYIYRSAGHEPDSIIGLHTTMNAAIEDMQAERRERRPHGGAGDDELPSEPHALHR